MFRSKELRANIYGLTDAWRDGGYSEDFITLSMARYHNRTLAVPKAAIFPNELGEIEFWKFWNFACRQIFVLTNTYATGAQRFFVGHTADVVSLAWSPVAGAGRVKYSSCATGSTWSSELLSTMTD